MKIFSSATVSAALMLLLGKRTIAATATTTTAAAANEEHDHRDGSSTLRGKIKHTSTSAGVGAVDSHGGKRKKRYLLGLFVQELALVVLHSAYIYIYI
jgi:hypothetical protein